MHLYLDNNATTRPLEEVQQAALFAMQDCFGNPSSAHSLGEKTRTLLSEARQSCADLIGALPEQIIFTSCGTESNNQALHSVVSKYKQAHIVTTTIEHSATLRYCRMLEREGHRVTYLPVDHDGRISLHNVETSLESSPSLLSIQWVNNETGTIQPIEEIAKLCKEANVPLHTDAAQAVGKLFVDLQQLPISYLSFTGHKLHAPPGVAVLYAKDPTTLSPLLYGGGQEQSQRPGTENVPGIAALGKACALRLARFDETQQHLRQLRDRLEGMIIRACPEVRINGSTEHRVCNTTNIQFTGVDGQMLMARLDQEGVYCSQSSACTSGLPEPSYVLLALGLSEDQAYASLRLSLGVDNTLAEVEKAADVIVQQYRAIQEIIG